MTNTSVRPITVDGVRLDTLAWNVTAYTRAVAARRARDVEVPGTDGLLPSLNDNLEPASFGLEMFVRGTDADGVIPGAGSLDTYRNNLDELVHLFGKRHALLDLQQQADAGGTMRRAWAKVTDTIAPEQNTPGHAAKLTVGLTLPYGVWEDTATQDWTKASPVSGTTYDVTTLQGATERITDAIALVTGPVNNPTLTDPNTGAYVTLGMTVAAGMTWRLNVGTWSTRYANSVGGPPASLGSSDTAGLDGQAVTTYGGTTNQAAFLPLVPIRSAGVRKVQVALSGTGFTSATALAIRARRKYAL